MQLLSQWYWDHKMIYSDSENCEVVFFQKEIWFSQGWVRIQVFAVVCGDILYNQSENQFKLKLSMTKPKTLCFDYILLMMVWCKWK